MYETVAPDEVLTFSGAEEAIFTAANVLLGPGDHAIVTWPAYQSLHEVARATGADVTLHELRGERGLGDRRGPAAGVGHAADEAHRRQRARTTRPACSPTRRPGPRSATSPPTRARSCSATRSTASSSVTRSPGSPPARTSGPHGVSLGVMSKSFSMAGLRIGWLASQDRALLDACRPVQGLPHDLLVRAVRDPRAHRPPGARPGAGPLARDRGRQPRPRRRRCSSARRRTSAGSGPRAGPSASRSSRADIAIEAFAREPARGGGGTPCAGADVRPPGQPLPARPRPVGDGDRARAARGVRRADAPLGRRRWRPGSTSSTRRATTSRRR